MLNVPSSLAAYAEWRGMTVPDPARGAAMR